MLEKELSRKILQLKVSDLARAKAIEGVFDYCAVTYPVITEQVDDLDWLKIKKAYPDSDLASTALKLAYAGHALDYDDFHPDFRGHPSVIILPCLLSLFEVENFTFSEFLDAYCVGIETAGRIGLAISQNHYSQGFHNTSTLGIFSGIAAVARLSKFTQLETQIALGLGATLSSGLRAQFGTAIKPLHAGFTAEKVLKIYTLIKYKLYGKSEDVLSSFFHAYGCHIQPEKLFKHWGEPFRIVQPGLEFKPYASCAGTHTSMDAVYQIKKNYPKFNPLDIEKIHLIFPPNADIAAYIHEPKTKFEGRFSLEYTVALALLKDKITVLDFNTDVIEQPYLDIINKTKRFCDSHAPNDEIDPKKRFNKVIIYLKNKETLEATVTRKEFVKKKIESLDKLKSCLIQDNEIKKIGKLFYVQNLCELKRLHNLLIAYVNCKLD